MLSRRGFVETGGTVALVSATSSESILQGLEQLNSPGFVMNRQFFANALNARFTGRVEGMEYTFVLEAIEDNSVSGEMGQFRLLFSASSGDLPEGDYLLSHEFRGQEQNKLVRLKHTSDDYPANIYIADFSLRKESMH